jgi:hypothetical protein
MKNEVLDLIHIKIHALRMMKNYKPDTFVVDVNHLIIEEYKSSCKECRERFEKIKYVPEVTQAQEKKSFLDILRGEI